MFCIKLDLICEQIKWRKMKLNLKTLIVSVSMAAVLTAAQSCSDNDNKDYYYYYPNAIVTVKPVEGGDPSFYMQLDDSTTLVAENILKPPFGDKEVRALASIEETGAAAEGGYDKVVHVYAIDSILTKNTVPYTDKHTVDSLYGYDPVEMIGDWMTVVEDGYITLRVRVVTGDYSTVHRLTLLTGVNPEDPYEVEFRHKIEGSSNQVYGPQPMLGDALVAFRLDSLPDTRGETVKLTLRWRAFDGAEHTATFDYCTRASSPSKMKIESGASFLTNIE